MNLNNWKTIEELEQLTHADAADIARCLAAEGVPSRTRGNQSVFETAPAEHAILCFQRNKIGGCGAGLDADAIAKAAQRAMCLVMAQHEEIIAIVEDFGIVQNKIRAMNLPKEAIETICALIEWGFARAAKIGQASFGDSNEH